MSLSPNDSASVRARTTRHRYGLRRLNIGSSLLGSILAMAQSTTSTRARTTRYQPDPGRLGIDPLGVTLARALNRINIDQGPLHSTSVRDKTT